MGTAASTVTILLLLACLMLAHISVRRFRLVRGGGVDVSLRRRSAFRHRDRGRDSAARWRDGVARYRGNELLWYQLTGIRLGPTVVIDRTEMEIVDRRPPTSGESTVVPDGASVLHARTRDADLELAMPPGVLTGFLAWLEAAPPGRTGYLRAS